MAAKSKNKPLKRNVGRREVADALGLSVSTVERMEGKRLPRTISISANRRGWPYEVIRDALLAIGHRLEQVSETDPERLSPEAIDEAVAGRLATLLDHPVDKADVRYGVERPATPEEVEAELQRRIEAWETAFAELPWEAQLVFAGWLFPGLRPGFCEALGRRGVAVPEDGGAWRRAALAALSKR